MYREKVPGEKERRRDTDLKELAHVSVGLSESKALGEASRPEAWGREAFQAQRLSAGRALFGSGEVRLCSIEAVN